MIYKLAVNSRDPKQAITPWWFQVEWLKSKHEIEFGPGLNVIWGENGSGKSTVLTAIAKPLCCFDGDHQLVGEWTAADMTEYDHKTGTRPLKTGILPVHDGSPIMHFDPSQAVGLMGGGFDWDFGDAGIQNAMFKGSSGQTTLMRMNRAIVTALDPKVPWPEVQWKGRKPEYMPELAEFLKGDGNRVRPTLLLDEPSRSLDLIKEIRLFKLLQKIADSGVQVIVATHSVFALHLKGAKFIDTSPGYSTMARIDTEAHFLDKLTEGDRGEERLGIMLEYVQKARAKRANEPTSEGGGETKGKTPSQKELLAIIRTTAEGHGKGRGWYKVVKRAGADGPMHALKDVKDWYTGRGRYFVSVGKGGASPSAHFEVNLP